jgi:hypothetical protein
MTNRMKAGIEKTGQQLLTGRAEEENEGSDMHLLVHSISFFV